MRLHFIHPLLCQQPNKRNIYIYIEVVKITRIPRPCLKKYRKSIPATFDNCDLRLLLD